MRTTIISQITLIPCLLLLGVTTMMAQQLPQRTPFGATNFIWNPAMTAFEEHWEAGITHRQEWVGFENAPQTSTIYAQYPFVKYNASLGGFFMLDQIKPIQNNVLALTYAYKISGSKGRKRKRKTGQLSIGLMASMSHIFIDGANVIATHANDPLQPLGEINAFRPNIGAGLFYISRPAGPDERSFFYAGAATNQLLPSDFKFRETPPIGNLARSFHGNAVLGYRSAKENLILEPSIWINLAGHNIINGQIGFKVEKPQAFWAGLHYNINQTVNLQIGYTLAKGFSEGGTMRIGAMGTYNVGDFGTVRGMGYEFYLAYRVNTK